MIKNIEVDIPQHLEKSISNKKIDAFLKSLALKTRTRMISATPVSSGRAARSWTQPEKVQFKTVDATFPVSRNETGMAFGNISPYSKYLETGSKKGSRPWPSKGPLTVMKDGQIYSSQAPSGMIQTGQIEQLIKQLLPGLLEKLMK